MCLAIPMQVRAIDGTRARCEADGIAREVSLYLLDDTVSVGDFVLVHVGYALRRIDAESARVARELRDQAEGAFGGAADA